MMIVKNDKKTVNHRDSNLELFRIFVMLLIICHHYVVNSGLWELAVADSFSRRSLFYLVFGAWGKTGINCFVLITGYFMCKSNASLLKFLKLIGEVVFYSFIIYWFFVLIGFVKPALSSFLWYIWPIRSIGTGFTSCYILFYLFIPFLNILIKQINRKQHRRICILLLFIYTILYSIPELNWIHKISISYNYITWFIVLYFLGSYLRFYENDIKYFSRRLALKLVISIAVGVGTILVGAYYASKTGNTTFIHYWVSDCNRVLAVWISIHAFMYAKKVRVPYKSFINIGGAATFGVLCIHANSDAMRQFLWIKIFHNTDYYSAAPAVLLLHALLVPVIIFIVCAIIDYIRRCTVEKWFLFGIERWIIKRKLEL